MWVNKSISLILPVKKTWPPVKVWLAPMAILVTAALVPVFKVEVPSVSFLAANNDTEPKVLFLDQEWIFVEELLQIKLPAKDTSPEPPPFPAVNLLL